MTTSKINEFDVDESIFTTNNPPTAVEVGSVPINGGKNGMIVYNGVWDVPFVTGSMTTQDFALNMPIDSSISFTHNNSSDIKLTDVPVDYGIVHFYKGYNNNYISGFAFSVINKTMYRYKYSGNVTSENGWHEIAQDIPNPNLLDNWYFGDPVNRRGLTEYSTTTTGGYRSIDRWELRSAAINLVEGGIEFKSPSGSPPYFCQSVMRGHFSKLLGQTVTISVLVSENTFVNNMELYMSNSNKPVNYGTGLGTIGFKGTGLFSKTITLPTEITNATYSEINFGIRVAKIADYTTEYAKIIAVKLELGDKQTLAHQDSEGNWILNEIPDYAEQMTICAQYDSNQGTYIGLPTIRTGTSDITAGSSTLEQNHIYLVYE